MEKWITEGAHGAQCVPNDQGLGCTFTPDATAPNNMRYHVVPCPDGDAGPAVQDCPNGQVCLVSGENGKCVPDPQGTP